MNHTKLYLNELKKGMSFFLDEGHQINTKYIISTLVLCFIGRGLAIFPLGLLFNCCRKHKLSFKYLAILWYSGLRGPVAYGMVFIKCSLKIQTTH